MESRKTAGLILLLLVSAASSALAAEDYAILLARPEKVGDRYRIDARGTSRQQQRVTLGGKVAGDEDKRLEIHLVALATVRAVDQKLEASRVEYRIESCSQSSSGKTEEVLPAGSKVIAESRDGDTVFTIDGRPVAPEVEEDLKVVISVHSPDSPTDDEIFGTHQRKRVGDKWGINVADAARSLSRGGLRVSPADLKGSVQLDGVRTLDSGNALEISVRFRADKISLDAPGGAKLEKGLLEAELSGFVPVDTKSRARLSDKMHMRMNVRMGGQKPETGEKISIEVSMEMSLENSYSTAPESVEF